METKELVIVGGGLSGILLALKLSNSEKFKNQSVTLVEEQPTLGGRLFFASSRSFSGKTRGQIQEELLQDASSNKFLSGFGFELFDLQTKESLFRHIQNSLTEEEKSRLEKYLSEFESEEQNLEKHKCYFVKKELTSSLSLLSGSSEILTKKEADYLKSIMTAEFDATNPLFSKGWQELSKQAREGLSQIFEVVVGQKWESIPFVDCCAHLKRFFLEMTNNYFLPFERKVAIEIFLEKILTERGVEIRNLCKLVRVEQMKKEFFSLTLSDEVEPHKNTLQAKHLVLALPLAKCAGILPKEIYAAEQSKFVSKVQPLSLVVYELSQFLNFKSTSVTLTLNAYDKFIFPVERVQGFLTSDGRMLFYTELDFEDSLQSPAVREAVSRLKRAAARLLNEDVLKEIKKGFRIPQTQFSERVILLPVAQSVPYFTKVNFELKQVAMGTPRLFCCGDSFFSLAAEPWKRIIHSVHDIAHLLI
ncbi:MAG: FAD/NAD(P)-binding protein [Bdellovibrionota bacterium]